MKTIGKLLKEARVRRRYSLDKVERETKIKKEFVDAIEKENWKVLPEYPVVVGFVKNLASSLKINESQAMAFLRRDYPPQKLSINPKPDVSKEFVWSPKLTFLVGVGVVLAVILGYLVFQYVRFVSPPELIVNEPAEGQVVDSRFLTVAGKTDTDATIRVNNQPVLINENGEFTTEIEISETTGEIEVKATSRSGKETVIRRNIKPELN